MTRKKSNVKALALAVTCAILAGGYSGLNPVYAADTLYKEGANVTTSSNSSTTPTSPNIEITELTVGGVTIGGGGKISGTSITLSGASEFNGVSKFGGATTFSAAATFNAQSTFSAGILANTISEATGGNGVTVGGVTFKNNNINTTGTITVSKLALSGGTHNLEDVGEAIDTNKANIAANTNKIDTKADKTDLNTANDEINALKEKTRNFDSDGITLTNMDEVGATKVSATTLAVGDKEITAAKVDSYDAAVENTAKIKQNTDGSTTVNDVTFNAGAVSGVKSINDKIKFSDDGTVASINGGIKISHDGKTVTFNEGVEKGQVQISEKGIKVGTGSTYISGDAVYTGGADYDNAKAGMKNDGSLKAAGGAFTVNTAGDIEGKDITATGNLSVAGTSTFTGKTTFSGGIKTDTIEEVTADKGVTVDGVLLKDKGISAADNKFTVDGATGDTTVKGKATFGNAPGALTEIDGDKLKTGVITTEQAQESNIGGVKMQNGKITASNMEITGAISLNDLTVNNELTVGAFSVDNTGVVTGVKSINGANVTASGTGLTIGSATVGDTNPFSSTGFTVDATGNVAAKDITAGTYNGNTIGADNKFNGVELKSGNVAATNVTAGKITDGIATMTGGKVTANEIAATSATLAGVTFDASGVDFNSKEIKNIAKVTATTADLGNLHIEGHVIKNDVEAGGPIGLGTTVTVNNAGELDGIKKIDGVNVIDNAGGLAIGTGATQVTIGGANAISVGTGTFTVDGAGLVTAKQFTTTNGSYLKDNELKLDYDNIWNTTNGIKAKQAVIGANTLNADGISTTGTLGVDGVATFGKNAADRTTITQGKAEFTQSGTKTTITGGKIITDTLTVNDIVLKNSMTNDATGSTITIKGSDGSMSVAGGKFAVDKDGQLTNKITGTAGGYSYETKLETSTSGIKANYTNAINGNQNIIDMGASGISIGVVSGTTPSVGAGFKAELDAATMGYGTANSIVVNKDTIKSALGTDVTRVMTNSATTKSIVDAVGTNASRTLKADEIVDAVGTTTVTTNSNGTTFSNGTPNNNTLINGSAITSTKATGDTGVLNGSSLTLTDATGAVTRSTALTAGGVTFTGADGRSDATGAKNKTIIDGGIITTDTLNVQRIELGDKLVDSNGTSHGSNLSMDEYGNIKAAGGNFTVAGTDKTNSGALHNEVGKTSFDTTETGASMKFDNTAATNGVTSEVAVKANEATVAAGDKASFVANTDNDGTATITGGTQTVTTTKDGTVFKNTAHNTPFEGGIVTETTINGNEITTGKITTDQLVIKGNRSGDTSGDGGESGSIAFGGDGSITSNIKDAATGKEATFKTNAEGTFTHAKDGANETTNTVNAQGNTNVVTDGTNTSTATQKATSIGGVVTNGTVTMKQELTADGVKFEQTGYDEVNIAKGDVTVTNNRNAATLGQEVHLSDLGSLNNLDGELAARDEYQDNKTAVGAINAEAGIRREEVARLDNRIDDVNNRVDKVGAMAAAIASLKSIGYDPQAPSEFSIGLGQYKGETGVAMGFFHYPNKNFMINVSLSTAGGETMGGIGATWRFGHKSPQKLLDEQREAQARKELAAAEKYQAAAKLAKEAQERAEYAAKLARQAQVSADNAKAAADATQAKHFQ